MIHKYGFIVKANNYDPQKDATVLETELFSTQIVGVSTDEQAVSVAKKFIQVGVQVIELCGGFGKESADKVISQVDSNIPIGFVIFSEDEQKKLSNLLA